MSLVKDGTEKNMNTKIFEIEKSFKLTAECKLVNSDLLVNLSGGNIPHIGGVVTFDKKTGQETSIKFASHDGRMHKDIFLAEQFAKDIENKLPGNLAINAGVHIDGITKKQIDDSFVMTSELAEVVASWVNEEAGSFKEAKYTTHLKRDHEGKLI